MSGVRIDGLALVLHETPWSIWSTTNIGLNLSFLNDRDLRSDSTEILHDTVRLD
jgi:hypothetical protein